MKNLIKCGIILLFALLIFWAGYTVGQNKTVEGLSDEGDSITFYAQIKEINGNSMLVSGLKENDVNFRSEFYLYITSNTKLEWHFTDIALSDFVPGQNISVTFSGEVQETYPAQIKSVNKICLLDDTNPALDRVETSSAKTYYMNADELGKTEQSLPCLTLLDKENFVFSYDILNSYIPTGTYEIADGELVASDKEKSCQYVFDVVDKNTLKFRKEKSADVSLIRQDMGIEITDGALFEQKNSEEKR